MAISRRGYHCGHDISWLARNLDPPKATVHSDTFAILTHHNTSMHSGYINLGSVRLSPPLKMIYPFVYATVQRQSWAPHLFVYLISRTLSDGPSRLFHSTTQLPLTQSISTSRMQHFSFKYTSMNSKATKSRYLY